MKTTALWLFCLVLAGCSSAPVARNAAGSSQPVAAASLQTPRYHYETVTEYSDGATQFLHLVPDSNP